jgi:UPF0755 protein
MSVHGRRRVLSVAGLLVAVALLWFLVSLFQPFKGEGHGRVPVSIPKGSGVGDIAGVLKRRGVVSSGFLFELRATLSGRRVQATIPEGRSRRETAALVGDLGLTGDYMKATLRSRLLDPKSYGGSGADNLEGFLFPSTYELKRGASVGTLVTKQLNAFKAQIRTVDMRAARHVNLTVYDVVTIASLVEREAQIAGERPLIARVIYNRLHEHIPLGIDATIRFATGNWTQPLTQSQLRTPSAYNTRTRAGLPPGPIGNPGLASLRAAAHPAGGGFLYYVVKPGTCGRHAFSTTYEQFQRDSTRYNQAREAAGGRSPTKC